MRSIGLLLAVPIIVLNFLSGIVGGIAILIQGDWSRLLIGIGYILSGPIMLSIAMLPAMIFVPLSIWAADKDNTILAVTAAIPNLLWTNLVVAASCSIVFAAMIANQDGDFFHAIWGYSVATAPWSFLAQKDRQSGQDNSTTLVFFVQLGTISMMVANFVDPTDTSPWRMASWFLPFLAAGLLLQILTAWEAIRLNRLYGR